MSEPAPLSMSNVPAPSDSWDTIWDFALTFNGYHHWGSFERCAEIANAEKGDTLVELRTCLFFERQRWQHYGDDPDADGERYIRSLVAKIRARIESGETV